MAYCDACVDRDEMIRNLEARITDLERQLAEAKGREARLEGVLRDLETAVRMEGCLRETRQYRAARQALFDQEDR